MMKKFFSMIPSLKSLTLRIRRDERGVVAVMIGAAITALAGLTGLVTQEAMIYRAQRAIQASTNLAALAAAQDINCCSSQPGKAKTTASTYSSLNPVAGQTVTMASGYPQLLCMSSTSTSNYSLPPCGGPTSPDNANAIVVKQQAIVPLILGGLFGKSTTTVTATATAGAGGGTGTALDVMLILDTTGSMNSSDSSCSISGATRVICAEAGARTLLQQFKPSLVHVGLMVFPGVSSSTASKDYDCSSSTQPTILAYNASPQYQIIGLSSDYKTSDTAASLNTSSNLVIALGGGASGCTAGLSAVGGVHTFYADVITAAQTALTTNGRSGVQKVIMFLSDGDANAVSSVVPSGKASNQCHEGITAAAAATAAGTKVYSLAYGAPTSGSCTTDSPAITACQAMQQIASTSAMFYSDTQSGSSACTSSTNTYSELVSLFNQVGSSLSSPRLLPPGTT